MKYIIIMPLLIVAMASSNAHDKHKLKEELPDTVQTIPNREQGVEINGKGSNVHKVPRQELENERINRSESDEFKLNYEVRIFSHLHNKLIHFPIALTAIAFLFTILSFKWNQFEFSFKWIVLIAAIFSVFALITGLNQADVFIGKPEEQIVELHKLFGIITMISLWLWVLFIFVRPLKRTAWILGFFTFILALITGFYGGILAH